MRFLRQIVLGNNLTKLTNIVEEMERRGASLPIGADRSARWPAEELKLVEAEFERRVEALSKTPRHLVTEALAKNLVLAVQMGRQARAKAVSRLLDILVSVGAAIPMDEFERSYA